MSYCHLTLSERHELFELKIIQKRSLGEISKQMGRAKSTLSRELKRNRVRSGVRYREGKRVKPTHYLPDTAQQMATRRRANAKASFAKVSTSCLQEIKVRLERYHSPQQIAGRLKLEGSHQISHETIYRMIYADHGELGAYKKYLRQRRKKRQKRAAGHSGRGQIPQRVGIEQRPQVADEKTQLGHWESDTMVGGQQRGALLTHVDKASKFLVAALAKDRTAATVKELTVSLFERLPQAPCLTLTCDNGKEFSKHQELSQALGASCYFARPYHSWERGLNEHTNGLLRQFFPKKTDFTKVTSEELVHAVDLINHRPRKSLAYQTPYEVQFASTSGSVALQR